MSPSLAIIIVNWNSFEVTRNCLESLRGLQYPDFEVVVVDNGSEDGSGQSLKDSFPEITLLENKKNLGFTGGNNRGINYALEQDKELVMLLNNDTIVTPDFATVLIDSLQRDENLGAIQPKVMFNQERHVIWSAGNTYSKLWSKTGTTGLGKVDNGQFDQANEIPWVTGCCFLVWSSVVREVGVLDDRFFIYYEDTDWSFRIRKAGYRLLYEPKAKIFHEVGKSNENRESFGEGNLSPFSHYITLRNNIYFLRKHTKGVFRLTSFIYQCVKITAYCCFFLLKGRSRKFSASLRGFWHGFTKPL